MKAEAVFTSGDDAQLMRDSVGHVEARGIEFIPEAERHGRPSDVALVFFGSQLTYGSIIMGAMPIAFGLTLVQSFWAILVGTLIGAAGLAGMAMLGPGSGTNSVVASGAFFGVRGRHVGSAVTEVIDLGYFGMCIWVCAPQLAQLLHLAGAAEGRTTMVCSIVVCALVMLAIGVLGHATIVAYEKLISCASVITIAIIVFACWLHPVGHPAGPGHYQLGGFWGSWMLAVSALIANAISYAPFAGDYARYMPSRTPPVSLFIWTLAGMLGGCAVGLSAGVIIALNVGNPLSVTTQMMQSLPVWLLVPVSLSGLGANIANGGMVVYNGILSLHAVLYKFKRVQVAYLFGALGLAIGYFGLIAYNMADSIMALCSVVTMLATPWVLITLLGYARVKGHFDTASLQLFDAPGGKYWYFHGYNTASVAAWFLAVCCGLPFSNNSLFEGPLAPLLDGVDMSFIVSAIVGAAIYLFLCAWAPQQSETLTMQKNVLF
jgi:purine-cytosine permease-like protein